MKLLLFVGLFACASAYLYRPPPFRPPQPAPPEAVIDSDYDDERKIFSAGVKEWLPLKQAEGKSSDNYYFNIVQNFFLPKPVTKVPDVERIIASMKKIDVSCQEHNDCKEHGHRCSKGVCKLEQHHPRHCTVDRDCKIRVPKGVSLHVPVHCNKGHCKLGRRKPHISKPESGPKYENPVVY